MLCQFLQKNLSTTSNILNTSWKVPKIIRNIMQLRMSITTMEYSNCILFWLNQDYTVVIFCMIYIYLEEPLFEIWVLVKIPWVWGQKVILEQDNKAMLPRQHFFMNLSMFVICQIVIKLKSFIWKKGGGQGSFTC